MTFLRRLLSFILAMTMNNKVSFDEILHGYTVSQAARTHTSSFILTFKGFHSFEHKGNEFFMQKRPKEL